VSGISGVVRGCGVVELNAFMELENIISHNSNNFNLTNSYVKPPCAIASRYFDLLKRQSASIPFHTTRFIERLRPSNKQNGLNYNSYESSNFFSAMESAGESFSLHTLNTTKSGGYSYESTKDGISFRNSDLDASCKFECEVCSSPKCFPSFISYCSLKLFECCCEKVDNFYEPKSIDWNLTMTRKASLTWAIMTVQRLLTSIE
jgi:hypothetical protein